MKKTEWRGTNWEADSGFTKKVMPELRLGVLTSDEKYMCTR